MKSTLEISSALYDLVNTNEIKKMISGSVYLDSIPDGDQKENIVVNVLTNSNNYLQVGFANVNIYIQQVKSGRPNIKRFREIVNKIIPLIEDAKINGCYFQIDSDNGITKSDRYDNAFYYNFKLIYET